MMSKRQLVGFTLLLALSSACTFSTQKRQIQKAERALSEKNPSDALDLLDQAARGSDVSLALEAAKLGAKIAQVDVKAYQRAVDLYRIVIVNSDDSDERRSAQKNIAQIFFENLLYYDKAVTEYEKLLRLDLPPSEKFQYRFNVAKSQLQLGNQEQALAELESLSKEKPSENDEYDLDVFKANILISKKKQDQAAIILEELMRKYPERAEKESIALQLTVCYEEMDQFEKAIATLEKLKKGYSHPEFLDTRIARLKTRLSNRPLANGFKK